MHRVPILAGLALAVACISTSVIAQRAGGVQREGGAPPERLGANDPFTVAVNTSTIEAGPVFVARERAGANGFRIINGGVRNVVSGSAHAGTNAETQMLAVPPTNTNVRMLLTVAEGLYRVIARKSAGISKLADLRGKKITTPTCCAAW